MDVTACKSKLPSGRERSSQSWFSGYRWLGGEAGSGESDESEESGAAPSTTA